MQHASAKKLNTYHRFRQVGWFVAALALVVCSGMANAASVVQGDGWTVDLSGYANAFYTTTSCPDGNVVGGTALAGEALGCGGQENRTTIGNGLLPNALITKFSTTQNTIDIIAQVSLMVPVATTNGLAANNGVDVRQAFFTVGTANFGTVKFGRDYGVFGSNAILSDMTLLGVGAPIQATQRGRVSLGHIGAGYTYLNSYGQITYTSPSMSGVTFTGGVFSPVNNNTPFYDSRSDPQVQVQLAYASGGFKGWVGAKQQKFYAAAGSSVVPNHFNMVAFEVGAKYSNGVFGVLANVQEGEGIGILTDGDQGDVKGVNYLLQGTWHVTPKLKLGLSGGISRNRDDSVADAHFKSNSNVTMGGYYALTKSVTLVVELSRTRSKDYLGHTARMNGISAGAIVFF